MKKILSAALLALLVLTLGFSAVAEGGDADYIYGKNTLIVGMTLFPPMNYYDQVTGEFVGFDTELALAVGEKLGLEIEFIEINWDSKEIELNSKSIDAIWNGMCITEERAANMAITEPYMINTQALVIKAEREDEIMADISGKTVVAEAGSTGEGKLFGTIADDETTVVSAKDYFADADYVPADSMAKAVLEVKAGTADAAFVDSVAAFGIVTPESDYADLIVNIDNNFGDQFYGIAFRKGSDMAAKVSEAIAELAADGTMAELAAKYNLSEMLMN